MIIGVGAMVGAGVFAAPGPAAAAAGTWLLAGAGFVVCVVLAFMLPMEAVAGGVGVLAAGSLVWLVTRGKLPFLPSRTEAP